MKLNVLLTGATGFVGRHLYRGLLSRDEFYLSCSVRSRSLDIRARQEIVGSLGPSTNWSTALAEVHIVIHAAALAHKGGVADSMAEYRRVNVEGTLNLARQAATAGVRRFVFISSIGVNGNINFLPFHIDDMPNPAELYAQSKWDAEQGLRQLAAETGMEVVIIRPPLVYGPGARGNFGSLVRWVEKGVPLPLGAIHNKRSLVGIDNLVDLIIRCIDHPGAANQVFLAGDGEDLSTTELLRAVGKAMGKPARLIPVPAGLLQFGATLLGKKAMAQRLLGSLQVDISKTCELLEWKPPYTVEEGLRRCFEPVK
ncbi:UDP-glucose 4-epimerase family protein [Stutzerimonas sp.]|uniref:UDP-glucose 4-epimerase family protein n=1 Tax=Stutzerimonas sp. TaxID=2901166 RepID=UPI0035AEE821